MNVSVLKLGTKITEKSTKLEGMLTLFEYRASGLVWYCVQPRGLNPETRQPIKSFWTTADRIEGGELITINLPTEVLGTQVTDEASGFTGAAIFLTQHISGCVHVGIQPEGTTQKGEVVESLNFDIRRCSGPAIPKMTESEREEDQSKKPSPGNHSTASPRY